MTRCHSRWFSIAASISPSGDYIAVLRGRIDGVETVVEVYNDRADLISSYPITPITTHMDGLRNISWSHDEREIFYFRLTGDENSSQIRLNLVSGEEQEVAGKPVAVLGSLPTGHLVVQRESVERGYFLLSPEDKWTKLSDSGQGVSLGAVVDTTRFLLNMDGNCYLYDITNHTKAFVSSGYAFGYDPATNRVFLLAQ